MSKERLELIETNWKNGHMNQIDFRWLINSVEELEEQLQASFFTMVEVDNMKVKLERYKQALEFYADEDNYKLWEFLPELDSRIHKVDEDEGDKARQALEGGMK